MYVRLIRTYIHFVFICLRYYHWLLLNGCSYFWKWNFDWFPFCYFFKKPSLEHMSGSIWYGHTRLPYETFWDAHSPLFLAVARVIIRHIFARYASTRFSPKDFRLFSLHSFPSWQDSPSNVAITFHATTVYSTAARQKIRTFIVWAGPWLKTQTEYIFIDRLRRTY